MKRENPIEHRPDEMDDWRADIRSILMGINTDTRLTADDKKLLKRFYFEKCLPPSIQDVARKYFPDEFTKANIHPGTTRS